MRTRALGAATRVWRGLAGGLQWRLLWLTQSTFMVGVCTVVERADGHVLLLRHRFYPSGREWGLPGGYLKAGETIPEGMNRELREEVGLAPASQYRLIGTRTGFRLRVELMVACTAHEDGDLGPDGVEVLEARWAEPGDVRAVLAPWQRDAWDAHRASPGPLIPVA